ncbi:MAG: CatB-related O-acetyltransferase [Quinella sp. 1Q5]|nr:CatB-related O-acetyltransferase [Quinella sp. 1Q5]
MGQSVTIMGGVKIGNGAVIGANAVVAKDIPPYAIAVGNPARIIKYRFDDETIRKLLAVKWWNWSLKKFEENNHLVKDVEKFLEAHYLPELEEFPEDDFSRQLKTLTGGGYSNLSPTSKQLSRCGLRSSKTSRKQSWTLYLSFGSARKRPTRMLKL